MSTNGRLAPGTIVHSHKEHSAAGEGIKGFFMLCYETTSRALLGDREAKETPKCMSVPGFIFFFFKFKLVMGG